MPYPQEDGRARAQRESRPLTKRLEGSPGGGAVPPGKLVQGNRASRPQERSR